MEIINILKINIFKEKYKLIIYIIINLINWITSLVIPYITSIYIDYLISKKDAVIIYRFSAIIFILSVIAAVCYYLSNILFIKMQGNITFNMNSYMLSHVQKLPLSYLRSIDPIYYNQRINIDCNTVVNFSIQSIINLIQKTITLFTVSIMLISISRGIFAMLSFLLPVYLILYICFKKPIFKSILEMKESQSILYSRMNEQINNIKYIKVNNMFNFYKDKLRGAFQFTFRKIIKFNVINNLFQSLDMNVNSMANLILIFYGGVKVINNEITIGEFTVINTYFSMLLGCISYFLSFGKEYQDFKVSRDRLDEIKKLKIDTYGDIIISEIDRIQIENLTVKFNNNLIIENFNCTLKRGNIYAFVGENGAGKTTLIDCIVGLYNDCISGKICYNGYNYFSINFEKLRENNISVCEQQVYINNESTDSNLRLSNCDYDMQLFDELMDKFKIINSNLIKSKKVSDIDAKLASGGEKQKIALIRTLSKKADLIILDEPTSALDFNSCKEFLDIVNRLKTNKIIVIITHDINIIRKVDYVINIGVEKNDFSMNII